MRDVQKQRLEAVACAVLFAYVFCFRVHGLDQDCLLRGDQMRDWDVAGRRFADLPLGGVPSSAGSTDPSP